ncbi:hypothetical protein FQZ97_1212550 [compost metagenome]
MSRYSSSINRSASFSIARSFSLSEVMRSMFIFLISWTISTTTLAACSSIAARGAKSIPSRCWRASE